MNLRTYVALEQAFVTRLTQAWREQTVTVYASIADLCDKGDFDAARSLAYTLDLTTIANENKEFIKYSLLSMAIFGASMAGKGSPRFLGTDYDSPLNMVVRNFIQYFYGSGTVAVRNQALQLIAEIEASSQKQDHTEFMVALKAGTATAEETETVPRYVKTFESFAGAGESPVQLAVSLNASRLASWGFIAEADARAIKRYKLVAVLDGRTSPFCTMIGERGIVFEVDAARDLVNAALSVQDPADLATVQPWPDQSKAAIAEYAAMSAEELVAVGLQIPPFHPHCRTILMNVDEETGTGNNLPLQVLTLPYTATGDTFNELGISLTSKEIDHWNTYMGVNPIDVSASLTGQDGAGVLGDKTSTSIFVDPFGTITQKNTTYFKSVMVDHAFSYDPFDSSLSLDRLDLYGGTLPDKAEYLSNFLGQFVDLGSTIGAKSMALDVGSDAFAFAKLGMLPSEVAWDDIRRTLVSEFSLGGRFEDLFISLKPEQQRVLLELLDRQSPEAIQLLVALPWEFEGRAVGETLLEGLGAEKFELDYKTEKVVDQFQEYLLYGDENDKAGNSNSNDNP